MKTSTWVTFGICILAVIIIGGNWLGIIPTYQFATQSLEYNDPSSGISFNYTSDLGIQDISQTNEKIRIINVMPKTAKNKFDPQFIEIITYKMPEATLEKSVIDFLPNINPNNLVKINRNDLQSMEYSQIEGVGEESLYTFFSNGEKIAIVIFRIRRFDSTNPLILIDNSRYLSNYRQIVNSFSMS